MRIAYNRNVEKEPIETAVILEEGDHIVVGIAYHNPIDGTPNKQKGKILAYNRVEAFLSNFVFDFALITVNRRGTPIPTVVAFNKTDNVSVQRALFFLHGNIERQVERCI